MTARPHELPRRITHSLGLKDGETIYSTKLSAVKNRALKKTFSHHSKATLPIFNGRATRRSQTSDTVIQLKDVSLFGGKTPILKSVNWKVKRGERWAVSGPNGAGKTTLLSLIIGDHPQSYAQHVALWQNAR